MNAPVLQVREMTPEQVAKLQEDWYAAIKANQQVARLNADLQDRVGMLMDCLRPFFEAYQLHKDDDVVVSKKKQMIVMNLSIGDFEKVAEVMSALEVSDGG